MFGRRRKNDGQRVDSVPSLLARSLSLVGDVEFEQGLEVLGLIQGNVTQRPGVTGMLSLRAEGRIEGDVSCHDALIDGTIVGDLEVEHLLELRASARVIGNISYRLLSMEAGATVEGTLTRLGADDDGMGEPPRLLRVDLM